MAEMITVAEGFQSSVNIAYDLNDNNKLKSYIPTKSALDLLTDVLISTRPEGTDRARILIGAYGKGKSHIVLMILSILMKKDRNLFEKMMPVVKADRPDLYALIDSYYQSSDRILPVIITGSNNSIAQAFMFALQESLKENELDDIMPETNFQAAVSKIADWKEHYPDVFSGFMESIDDSIDHFCARLQNFDPLAYEEFERIYPSLTAGSSFNPFIGFNVVDVYASVVKSLRTKGYTGIYVVFDEFSKYLENHIAEAAKSDTKILQDFAEYCGRSGKEQLHLMLISHKEITSYIDRASKATIDGWRGVSERFKHVYLNNNFTQTYEIIASAIVKDPAKWEIFKKENQTKFGALKAAYMQHPIFSDLNDEEVENVLYGCYPLHPVSTYILPRLSERVAQNERTLFTFVSSSGDSTLSSFLKQNAEGKFALVTPDLIYDYFEPLLKQEIYSGNLHKYYILATSILRKIEGNELGSKIIKTIALIYILEQFEKLAPTMDELVGIYSSTYSPEDISGTVKNLIEEQFVVYLKRSNGYLRLKETSGVNIREEIANTVARRLGKINIKQVLNDANFDSYLYPSRYNDDREMTRYFKFEFINSDEVTDDVDWNVKSENIHADGTVFAIIPRDETEIARVNDSLHKSSIGCDDCIFVVPKAYQNIDKYVRDYDAVQILMQSATDDRVLFEDYEVVYEDLREVIKNYINTFTHPENNTSKYIFEGKERPIHRKSELTGLLSDICEDIYCDTPAINNEVVNKEELTSVARNSCGKIISGLLRDDLEPNLGLKGNGQEISIMRSTLINPGILVTNGNEMRVDLDPADVRLASLLHVIRDFVLGARTKDYVNFEDLYKKLILREFHIGLRRGLIPIYLATVLHEYRDQVVIYDSAGQIPLNTDAIEEINAKPSLFKLSYIDWDQNKEDYVNRLSEGFCGKAAADYDSVAVGIRRWYMGLPKYPKNVGIMPNGQQLSREDRGLLSELRKNDGNYDLLFKSLPEIYGSEINGSLADKVIASKDIFDGMLGELIKYISKWMREEFCTRDIASCSKMSLASIIKDWCEKIDPKTFEQLFPDGTDRCLKVFRDVTNDEDLFIRKVARMATDLRIEDWDQEVIEVFKKNMLQYRATAEAFHPEEKDISSGASATEGYELSYTDGNGDVVTKRFEKVEDSKRGKLLYNSLISEIDSMGQSISEQEKRQILMEVLKKYC